MISFTSDNSYQTLVYQAWSTWQSETCKVTFTPCLLIVGYVYCINVITSPTVLRVVVNYSLISTKYVNFTMLS